MAKTFRGNIQPYPREENFLKEDELKEHSHKIPIDELKEVIKDAIIYADEKSKRQIQFEFEGDDDTKRNKKFLKEARELFKYFLKYPGDPAATAYHCVGKHYLEVANDSFRNRIIQMERMNSGWRYQSIAKDSAALSKRFESVSDLNMNEADFVALINYKKGRDKLNIYVSVKNRSNTVGGQDFPNAIRALENAAVADKNRKGPYICVFGIAMDKGARAIRRNSKTKMPYSFNTEIWFSNFFWPFFSNYSYEEISIAVLEVLMELKYQSSLKNEIPNEVIELFGEICGKNDLVDEYGVFNNPEKLVKLFCGVTK